MVTFNENIGHRTPQKLNRPTNAMTDTYTDPKPTGKVIGSSGADGTLRKGIDSERKIAVDNGALRIQPLLNPGWEKSGIAYGPYRRENGLALGVFLLNGHNTSENGIIAEGFIRRVIGWMRGSDTQERLRFFLVKFFLHGQFLRLLRGKQKRKTLKRLLFWKKYCRNNGQPHIDNNLAVGWFPNEVPTNPIQEGNAFITHALGPQNGELRARIGSNLLPAIKGLQNLPIYYIIILREKGAAYYVASVPNALGLATFPEMRPVAVDAFNDDPEVYAGIYQSVLGQIGFVVDTRVYATHIDKLTTLPNWFGTAHAADKLCGHGSLSKSSAEAGGLWNILLGHLELTPNGARPIEKSNLVILTPQTPSGLIHLILEIGEKETTLASVYWRVQDIDNLWSFTIDGCKWHIRIKEKGLWSDIASGENYSVQFFKENSIQITDDGNTNSIFVNGKLLPDKVIQDFRLKNATGIGFGSSRENDDEADKLFFRFFEAHPRTLPIPDTLKSKAPWTPPKMQIEAVDHFNGGAGHLEGKRTSDRKKIWAKSIGQGIIQLTGKDTAQVAATVEHPNPGRTAYTIAWDHPKAADLEIDMTPPGTRRGQKERGRGGLIFWQNIDNYIIVNTWLDDDYAGASISSFFYINGYEDIYDAVWTNVGSRIYWGKPYTLRVIFDGMHYMANVNDEPVLYRALSDVYPDIAPMTINRVGITANWEFGNDTGTVFNKFIAKQKVE